MKLLDVPKDNRAIAIKKYSYLYSFFITYIYEFDNLPTYLKSAEKAYPLIIIEDRGALVIAGVSEIQNEIKNMLNDPEIIEVYGYIFESLPDSRDKITSMLQRLDKVLDYFITPEEYKAIIESTTIS